MGGGGRGYCLDDRVVLSGLTRQVSIRRRQGEHMNRSDTIGKLAEAYGIDRLYNYLGLDQEAT